MHFLKEIFTSFMLILTCYNMLDLLLVFSIILIIFWYWKSYRHPKDFPPGPRLPVPLFGDGYVLGGDFNKGFKNLLGKYGKICGFWLGPKRATFIADFDILQEALNKPETSDRETPSAACKFKIRKIHTKYGQKYD